MSSYVLTIDNGTTGTTCLLFNQDMHLVAKGYQEFNQIYPRPGWVEHNLTHIWSSVRASVEEALRNGNVDPATIVAIGITNQRETVGIWERDGGAPMANAIVWQDRRTADRCAQLVSDGKEPWVTDKTGLLLDPYFSGTKIEWMLDNTEGLRERAATGELAAGTIDTFLVWRLSGGKAHVTDASNASRTLLCNIKTLQWDNELLDLFNVPKELLPEIRGCSETYALTEGLNFLPDGIPIAGIAGDQQAALFGQCCFEEGEAKCTFGTGAFMLTNTGSRIVKSRNRLLTTVAWKIGDEVTYAIEGSSFIAGAAVQWLRDGLRIIDSAPDIEPLAASVEDSGGVVVVPAFVGLGAPHWRPDARASISGITRGTTRAHIARATLEGIALQICDLANAMEQDMGHDITALKVDGGAAVNDLLMQMQSDYLNARVVRPKVVETTALGAAALAGLAVGFWKDLDDIRKSWNKDRDFDPVMDEADRAEILARWNTAVEKT